jgi:hypothetical protein
MLAGKNMPPELLCGRPAFGTESGFMADSLPNTVEILFDNNNSLKFVIYSPEYEHSYR